MNEQERMKYAAMTWARASWELAKATALLLYTWGKQAIAALKQYLANRNR